MTTCCVKKRPFASTQVPPMPVSDTQPAVPASCVSAPVVASRAKTATAQLVFDATYTCLPSGLTMTSSGPSSALPSAQPLSPVSETQPAVPASCASPPDAVRVNTATASLLVAAR